MVANTKEYLERADANTFFLAPRDKGSELAASIGKLGLARIHLLQERFGLRPDALFLVGPDASPSRNTLRCVSGFITGGNYIWGDGKTELIPLVFYSNACGLCTVGLPSLPDKDSIFQRLLDLQSCPPSIDGINVMLDFAISNHFIAVYKLHAISQPYDFSYISILHCSAPELKVTSPLGIGLHPKASAQLSQIVENYDTPLGSIPYVSGANAIMYYNLYRYADWFAKKKRALIAMTLFPEGTILNNRMHLGLTSMNECRLGNQIVDGSVEAGDYPFLLGPNAVSFLFSPKPNLDDQCFAALGYGELSPHYARRLATPNLVPHGGGYLYDYIADFSWSLLNNGNFLQLVILTTAGNELVVPDVTDLPYRFRDESTLNWCESYGICRRTAALVPEFCLRL